MVARDLIDTQQPCDGCAGYVGHGWAIEKTQKNTITLPETNISPENGWLED